MEYGVGRVDIAQREWESPISFLVHISFLYSLLPTSQHCEVGIFSQTQAYSSIANQEHSET